MTWFCIWQGAEHRVLAVADRARLVQLATTLPGLKRAHVMSPADIDDPHFRDRSGTPSLVLQLDFRSIAGLESALARSGRLARLCVPDFMPSLAGLELSQQSMIVRRYPLMRGPRSKGVAYWVEYAGATGDTREWLYQYAATHPQILTRFPEIRLVELYTPASVVCGLPIPIRPCVQRNKTVWDSRAAMNRAMASPVRAQLRADMAALPPFDGQQWHFPFTYQSAGPKARRATP